MAEKPGRRAPDCAAAATRQPANALTAEERERVVEVCNTPEHASLPVSQIVPRLADQGVYIASESTFRRVLRERGQAKRRGRAKEARPRKRPTTHVATKPGQIWVWDVTWLKSGVAGRFWYLWLITDLYSRKIVGWEVWAEESAAHSAELLERTVLAEAGTRRRPLILHGDNGSSMKAFTLDAKMEALGIVPSRWRTLVIGFCVSSAGTTTTIGIRPLAT